MLPNSFLLIKKRLACSIYSEAPSRGSQAKLSFQTPLDLRTHRSGCCPLMERGNIRLCSTQR